MTAPELFLETFVSTHAEIDGDIVQLGVSTTNRNRIPINDNNSEDPQ
jgi:hypothetical protein